jgi:hypothetical protein
VTLPFVMEPWETFAELADRAPQRAPDGLCAWPDCRRAFTAAKPWQRYCCAACRRADQDEARAVGHAIARPALTMRETKHAARGSRAAQLNTLARRYVDTVMTRWRDCRALRSATAEDRAQGARPGPAPSPRPARTPATLSTGMED